MKIGVFGLLLFWFGFVYSAKAQSGPTDSFKIEAGVPPFLYEGDHLEIVVKLFNEKKRERTGQVALQLFDATTNTSVDGWFQNVFPVQFFTVDARATSEVSFPIEVPYLFKKPIRWRVVAQQEKDTSESKGNLQIFSAKRLVTEKQLLPLLPGTHTYRFKNLAQSDAATEHQLFAVHYFSNPMLQVAFALPGLAAITPASATEMCNSYVAYALAAHLNKTEPQLIRGLRNEPEVATTSGFLSQQPFNNDSAETKQVSDFFDSASLQNHLKTSFAHLQKMQTAEGGFSWFEQGPPDDFITQLILTNLAYVQNLEAIPGTQQPAFQLMITNAFTYLDSLVAADYTQESKTEKRRHAFVSSPALLSFFYLHYQFKNIVQAETLQPVFAAFLARAKAAAAGLPPASRAMLASIYFQNGQQNLASGYMQQLKQNGDSKTSANPLQPEPWWMDAVTKLAIQIDAFGKIKNDTTTIAALQKKLLAAKTYNGWQTPAATIAASYSLLRTPATPAESNEDFELRFGKMVVQNPIHNTRHGYFKKLFLPPFVQPELAAIEVTLPETSPKTTHDVETYWQYFSDMPSEEKITGLTIKEDWFRVGGNALHRLNTTDVVALHAGDTIRRKLTISANRAFSYMQLNVSVAAGFRVQAGSFGFQQHKNWGYYADAGNRGISYFMPQLISGTTVLEQDVVVATKGTFTNAPIEIVFFNDPNIRTQGKLLHVQVE